MELQKVPAASCMLLWLPQEVQTSAESLVL